MLTLLLTWIALASEPAPESAEPLTDGFEACFQAAVAPMVFYTQPHGVEQRFPFILER